jgi:hypothetical protein
MEHAGGHQLSLSKAETIFSFRKLLGYDESTIQYHYNGNYDMAYCYSWQSLSPGAEHRISDGMPD